LLAVLAEDALCLYRLVRLTTEDELTRDLRERAQSWALDRRRPKLHYWLGCPYCQSLWWAPMLCFMPKRLKRALAAAGVVALIVDLREALR
jgi:hypothetical protein